MDSRRLGVIGSVNVDAVTTADGQLRQGLGGVLYTVLALSALGRGAVEVWPVCFVGDDVRSAVVQLLSTCGNARLDGLVPAPASYRCRLRYLADGSKEETLVGEVEPLTAAHLQPLLAGLDALLVNFITGYEIERRELSRVRSSLRGPMVVDVHSLTLGRDAAGRRFWRRPEDWREWVALADVVQMNASEAALLGGLGPAPEERLVEFARSLVQMGPDWAVITRGPLGVVAVSRDRDSPAIVAAADEPERAVDTTGCGDIFLAALALGRVFGMPLDEAVRAAVHAAGLGSRRAGVGALLDLPPIHRV